MADGEKMQTYTLHSQEWELRDIRGAFSKLLRTIFYMGEGGYESCL
jgi:hypothetical protein